MVCDTECADALALSAMPIAAPSSQWARDPRAALWTSLAPDAGIRLRSSRATRAATGMSHCDGARSMPVQRCACRRKRPQLRPTRAPTDRPLVKSKLIARWVSGELTDAAQRVGSAVYAGHVTRARSAAVDASRSAAVMYIGRVEPPRRTGMACGRPSELPTWRLPRSAVRRLCERVTPNPGRPAGSRSRYPSTMSRPTGSLTASQREPL
jgi:hypothetical protein